MKNFFISYNKADRDWAEWLDWFLRSKGLSTFTQFNDIPWGTNFVSRMDDGLKQAERLILVLSPDFLSSGFTEAEWTTMFAKDPNGSKGLLLPIRVRECELTGLLATRVYLDLWDADEAAAGTALQKGLGTLNPPVVPGPGNAAAPAPPYPYLRYDFFVEYCETEAVRVEALAAQLESLQKKVWRDVWMVQGPAPVRRKNRPASLRCACHVVCVGDSTSDAWANGQIQNILAQQQQDRSLKFVPVVFGAKLATLKQAFPDVLFWGDASNAIHLLQAAAPDTNLPPADPVEKKKEKTKTFLITLAEMREYLDPNVLQQAQLDAITRLREAIDGK